MRQWNIQSSWRIKCDKRLNVHLKLFQDLHCARCPGSGVRSRAILCCMMDYQQRLLVGLGWFQHLSFSFCSPTLASTGFIAGSIIHAFTSIFISHIINGLSLHLMHLMLSIFLMAMLSQSLIISLFTWFLPKSGSIFVCFSSSIAGQSWFTTATLFHDQPLSTLQLIMQSTTCTLTTTTANISRFGIVLVAHIGNLLKSSTMLSFAQTKSMGSPSQGGRNNRSWSLECEETKDQLDEATPSPPPPTRRSKTFSSCLLFSFTTLP